MIALDADATRLRDDRAHRAPVIVALPVGINQVVAETASPGLPEIDIRRDGNAALGGDDTGVRPAKGAVEKAGIIGDVVHRGQQHRVDAAVRH